MWTATPSATGQARPTITGNVLGNELPAGGDPATVFDSINGVLATAGVQIIAGQTIEEADEDGSTAQASSEGLGIIVNPLKAAKPLVSIQLVPAGVAVAADRAALPPDEEPEAPVDPPNDIPAADRRRLPGARRRDPPDRGHRRRHPPPPRRRRFQHRWVGSRTWSASRSLPGT